MKGLQVLFSQPFNIASGCKRLIKRCNDRARSTLTELSDSNLDSFSTSECGERIICKWTADCFVRKVHKMVKFNAFQVLQIAEQIERNASKFYREAAELFDEPGLRKVLFELADWEGEHEETFENMRKQLSEQPRELRTFDLDEPPPSPKAMAGLAVFGTGSDPTQEFRGKEKRTEMLKMAIEKEKDTITYYKGLKDFVPPQNGHDKFDDIIEEEWKHIKILEQSLESAIVVEPS